MKEIALILFLSVIAGVRGQGTLPSSNPPSRDSVQHWSLSPPRRIPQPVVEKADWVRNSIDAFVLAKLEKEHLQPSPEADRWTLIRRLSLDLRGLPPSADEVEAFIHDPRADAYEQLADRFLASPHFGERFGRHWLDLARYADSDGYEKDSPRPFAYVFRDWVIDAINRDLPFDQFTIEQLAGDLLPGATEGQRIATGFHRNTLTNKEGGVDQEEFRCKATVDRVSTTATVWLGLTAGCAECHNHKYDPISQREFYQLYAFFNNASEKDISAPRPDELVNYNLAKLEWDQEQGRRQEALTAYIKNEAAAKQDEWERTAIPPRERWTVLKPYKVSSVGGTTFKTQSDGSVKAAHKNPPKDETYTLELETELKDITGLRLEVFEETVTTRIPVRNKTNQVVLSELSVRVPGQSDDTESGNIPDPSRREVPGGKTESWKLVPLRNASADHVVKGGAVETAIDGNPKTGWVIDPLPNSPHVAVIETVEDLNLAEGTRLTVQMHQQGAGQHTIGHFRISATRSVRPLKASLVPDSVIQILETPVVQRTDQQKSELMAYYLGQIDPTAQKLRRQLADHAKAGPKFPETKAPTLIENDTARQSNIHIRGDFLRKGDAVQPLTPAVLHPFKARGENPDRLDLARWLFDPANPLTSRVAVNRVWYHLFGRGLVASMNDFGTRGEKPSHPELLDWLATEFPRLGWSRKALIKFIVASSTYRQISSLVPELAERDPNNLWLARQSRFRLEAENVRDACLAASGLLNPTVGGPAIRPPLPADIAALGYANSVKWKESEGADRYRRGLYIFFQRTVPYPMLATFDAPDSNATCTSRERSNTPLQALTLLNDPVFFECAQALGKRMARDPAASSKEKIRGGFTLCLAREPASDEMDRLEKLYGDYLRMAQTNLEQASKMIGTAQSGPDATAEIAALTGVGRIILNLDEFVTRE